MKKPFWTAVLGVAICVVALAPEILLSQSYKPAAQVQQAVGWKRNMVTKVVSLYDATDSLSVSGLTGNEITDNLFRVTNLAAPTKKVSIDASSVTAGNTRSIVAADGTMTLTTGTEVVTVTSETDGVLFIPAPTGCAVDATTMAVTRTAANDWKLARTAAGAETFHFFCDLGSWLQRSTATKGVEITGLKVVQEIGVNALTSNGTMTLSKTAYVNNTPNAVTAFGGALTYTGPTATQANPYVTTVTVGTPAYFTAADSALTLEFVVVMQANGTYAFDGVSVAYRKINH